MSSTVNGVAVTKPEQVIVGNAYDALGQLKKKTLGDGSLDNPEYSYNIRGWLTAINKGYLDNSTAHFFGMELGYDQAATTSTCSANPTTRRTTPRRPTTRYR